MPKAEEPWQSDSCACTEGGEMDRQVGLDEQDEHCTQKDDAEWGWSVHTQFLTWNQMCRYVHYVDVTGRAPLSESRSHHL